jgi:predicted DNA-binding transcriptional regulator YafY
MSIVLLLQARGRLTADELAAELEVSVRTIYRDIDALHEAGIPLYGSAGRDGGYQLLDGYRTRLDGLSDEEAGYLFLTGLPGPAAELGYTSIVSQVQRKLLAAMPEGPRQRALDLSKRFLFDAPGWFQEGDRSPHLAAVARAVWDRHRITVLYRSWTNEAVRTLEPYGLVLKNGTWYVAAATAGGTTVRTYRVNQILDLTTLDESFDVPDSFDLQAYWSAGITEFRAQRVQGTARIKVTPTGRDMLRSRSSGAVAEALDNALGGDSEGWLTVEVPIESIDYAHNQFLGIGAHLEVLDPPQLRARLAETATQLAEMYGAVAL